MGGVLLCCFAQLVQARFSVSKNARFKLGFMVTSFVSESELVQARLMVPLLESLSTTYPFFSMNIVPRHRQHEGALSCIYPENDLPLCVNKYQMNLCVFLSSVLKA